MPSDLLSYIGDFPQDWPPGPINPNVDTYYGRAVSQYGLTGVAGNEPPLAPFTTAGTAVLPTPIGNQLNASPPAASMPPLIPSGPASGTPQNMGPGAVIVPPTYSINL